MSQLYDKEANMKVLIVGGGGREHAIAASVAKSSKVEKIYCLPGNAGIARIAECAPIGPMEFDKIVAFAKEKEVDLTIVGMDDPLVGGLVDELEAAGIRAFGPRKNAAILEGSKAFSKDLMKNTTFRQRHMKILTMLIRRLLTLRQRNSRSFSRPTDLHLGKES